MTLYTGGIPAPLAAAYDRCLVTARGHYENFPVASWLVPRTLRPHVAAIYAFARGADDLADEGSAPAGWREVRLDEWMRWLHEALEGESGAPPTSRHIFDALAWTIRRFQLPVELFEALVSAFRQDVTTTRYETWADVLDYCERSANPVGRLVLRLWNVHGEAIDHASDDVCTALQLTNFWQDVAADWRRGRLYVPLEDVRRAGVSTDELSRGVLSPPWRGLLREAGCRTRELFERGRAVGDVAPRRLRWELRATWAGGIRVLDRLDAQDYDVFAARPALGPGDALPIAWRLLTWRKVSQ